ncbi:MAG: DivIVA domain-containing protein [Oscillospiraceae bacterium]|nr:DivIVA domain-containing protein [Oscillospiraceae bacterium]
MLTSKDIRSTSFEQVRRGYSVEDVDAFLKKVAGEFDAFQTETVSMLQEKDAELEALKREKKDLENKMLVIADKLEEYRSKENMIMNAFMSAEKMKEEKLAEARQTSEILIRDAQQKAEKILESANNRVVTEEQNYLRMQQEVAKFKNKVLDIYKSHLAVLNSLPNDIAAETDAEPAPVAEEPVTAPVAESVAELDTLKPVEEAVKEVEETVEEVKENVDSAVEEIEEKVEDLKYDGFAPRMSFPEEKPVEERKSRFGNLDFGDKFDFGNN